MKAAIATTAVSLSNSNCLRTTPLYGDTTPASQLKTDLDKLKTLDQSYQGSGLIVCVKGAKLLSFRTGVSNYRNSVSHSNQDTWWLTTMGPGSLNADFCE